MVKISHSIWQAAWRGSVVHLIHDTDIFLNNKNAVNFSDIIQSDGFRWAQSKWQIMKD